MGMNSELHMDIQKTNYFIRLADVVNNSKQREQIQKQYKVILPTADELQHTAKLLDVDAEDLYYTGSFINPYVYAKGLLYVEFMAFDEQLFNMLRLRDGIKVRQKYIDECLENKDFISIFSLIEDKFKVMAFRDVYEQDILTPRELYKLFRSVYTKIDYGFTDEEDIEMLEAILPTNPNKSFRKKIQADANGMVTIYRGVESLSKGVESAYSWTLKEDVAHFFASRFTKNGVIYKAKVHISNIMDYFDDRGEEEVLVLPKSIINPQIIHGNNVVTLDEMLDNEGFMVRYRKYKALINPQNYLQGIHGADHIKRVLFLSLTLAEINELPEEDKDVLALTSVIHDLGRKHDYEDKTHGKLSYPKALKLGFVDENTTDLDIIKFVTENHCLHDAEGLKNLEDSEIGDKDRAKKLYFEFKDSDGADRTRLGDLDERYLRSDTAKALARNFAYELLDRTDEI